MNVAGFDHLITIEPLGERLRVRFGGESIVDSVNALVLRETVYPPIYYVPREDVEMAALTRSDHSTKCPHKGTASYFNIEHGGQTAENAVWSYETPLEEMNQIREHLAFYPRYVEFEIGGTD